MRFENLSFIPPLTDMQVKAQITDIIGKNLLPIIEYAEAPMPAQAYWQNWPIDTNNRHYTSTIDMSGLADTGSVATAIFAELKSCASHNPYHHVRMSGYDKSSQTYQNSFIFRAPSE